MIGTMLRRLAGLSTRPGGPIAAVDLDVCMPFFGYTRIHAYAVVANGDRYSDAELRAGVRAAVSFRAGRPVQRCRILSVQPNRAVEFEIDALVDRAVPIDQADLVVWFGRSASRFPLASLLPYARARDLRTMLPRFQALIREQATRSGSRPTILDIGGRARSGVQWSEDYPDCDTTVLDIIAAPGVDVVADAHEMSRHLPAESFDFAMSLSVFEHLLMPWKVAVEINRVLKPGGVAFIYSHQTVALHELPWDYLRFSSFSWVGMFNAHTGFEIIETDMSYFVHVVPAVFPDQAVNPEKTGGYVASGVMARKIGPSRVDWPVPLADLVDTTYPTAPDAAVP